jgi:electron transport complex protein RnfB
MKTVDEIDQLLPQTQCGLCEYDGCRPYAEAMINSGEAINRCPPGGVETLVKLGEALGINPSPYIEEVQDKAKPDAIVSIREDECIGCTKCIQACPTDAILGAAKLMHTIITDACTGCELCIEPCPVDCIDIIELPIRSEEDKQTYATQWRNRYNQRNERLVRLKELAKNKHQRAKLLPSSEGKAEAINARKSAILEAVARAKAKRNNNS